MMEIIFMAILKNTIIALNKGEDNVKIDNLIITFNFYILIISINYLLK